MSPANSSGGHADPADLLDSSGPAAPPRDNGELVFAAPWESRAFGLALALSEAGLIDWEDFRQALIREIGDWEAAHPSGEGWSYYECWLRALERTAGARGLVDPGALADFAVDWVIGGKRMQDDLTVFADGRWQVLPVYFQVTPKKWVDYTETTQGRLLPDHPFYWTNLRRMANRECLDCHVTGLDVRFDREAHRWSTEFVDACVACEDCHGPGARHADTTLTADIFLPKRAPTWKRMPASHCTRISTA